MGIAHLFWVAFARASIMFVRSADVDIGIRTHTAETLELSLIFPGRLLRILVIVTS